MAFDLETFSKEIREYGYSQAILFALHNRYEILLNWLLKLNFESKYGKGLAVMEEDWDNLILLDACRYDTFEQHTRFEGKLDRVISKGNSSPKFMTENFSGRRLHDVIYVSANPYSVNIREGVFFKIISLIDEWDPDSGTVLPEVVISSAMEAQRNYPDKKLIIHFMQPHAPHIGKYRPGIKQSGVSEIQAAQSDGMNVFDACKNGIISHSQLNRSYISNFKFAEEYVERLIHQLIGKTIISADHGENLGETYLGKNWYSHSQDTPECRFVPWLELEFSSRKNTKAANPENYDLPDEDTVNERLQNLGYL